VLAILPSLFFIEEIVMKKFTINWYNGTWVLSTDFFGKPITSAAKTVGRAHFNLERMYQERLGFINKRVWEGV